MKAGHEASDDHQLATSHSLSHRPLARKKKNPHSYIRYASLHSKLIYLTKRKNTFVLTSDILEKDKNLLNYWPRALWVLRLFWPRSNFNQVINTCLFINHRMLARLLPLQPSYSLMHDNSKAVWNSMFQQLAHNDTSAQKWQQLTNSTD